MLGAVRERRALPEHDLRAAVLDAVVEIGLGGAPGERDEHRARPLCGPVEERRLDAVVEHGGEPLAALEAEPARDPRRALAQLRVRDAGERLRLRSPLGGGEQGEREVQGASAASAIASTMGS